MCAMPPPPPNQYNQPPPPPPPPGYGGGPQPPPGYGPPAYQEPLDTEGTLRSSFDLYKNNFSAIFFFWAVPALLGIGLNLFSLLYFTTDYGNVSEPEDLSGLWLGLGGIIGVSFISMLVSILFTGGIIGMVREAMQTGKTTPHTGYETIKQHFGGILIVSIATSIIIGIGFVLCCIPGILFCYWWMFAVVAVVVEGTDLSRAMSNSKEFATTRHTFMFAIILIIVMIVLNVVAGMISTPISIIVGGVNELAGHITSSVVSGVLTWVIQPFSAIAISYHYIKGKGLDKGPVMQGMPPGGYQPGYAQPPPPSF